MIGALSDLTLDNGLTIFYAALAAALSWGIVLGVVGVWLSTAARGGESK